MIGARARALDDRLTVDFTELDDARWFNREEVAAAVAGEPAAAFLPRRASPSPGRCSRLLTA